MGASPSRFFFFQNALAQQVVDVANGRVFRAFSDFGPFGRAQLPLKAIKELVYELFLSFIEDSPCVLVPEISLDQDTRKN